MREGEVPPETVALDEMVLHHPVNLAVQAERVLLQPGQQVFPHLDRLLHRRREPRIAGIAERPLQVLPLDVERRQLASVGEAYSPPACGVVADLPDGAYRVLQAQVAKQDVVLQHLEDARGRAHLHVGGVFGHVGVPGDDVQPPEPLGVGVRLVAGVDDGTAPGGGGGHSLPDVLRPLRHAIHGAPSGLQQFAAAGVDLAGDEERDQGVDDPLEVAVAADEVVLVATVGVTRRVGVVLEQVDLTADSLFLEPLLGGVQQSLEDSLPRLVVGHHVVEVVAFGGGVLGMAAHVEIQPGAVLQKHVRGAAPADHAAEQVPGDFIRAEAALAAQRASDAVLVLDAEDATIHRNRVPRCAHIEAAPGYFEKR